MTVRPRRSCSDADAQALPDADAMLCLTPDALAWSFLSFWPWRGSFLNVSLPVQRISRSSARDRLPRVVLTALVDNIPVVVTPCCAGASCDAVRHFHRYPWLNSHAAYSGALRGFGWAHCWWCGCCWCVLIVLLPIDLDITFCRTDHGCPFGAGLLFGTCSAGLERAYGTSWE